jgi:hypothetical protein
MHKCLLNVIGMIRTFLPFSHHHVERIAAERVPRPEVDYFEEVLLFVDTLHEPELRNVFLLVWADWDYAGTVGVVFNTKGDVGVHCYNGVQRAFAECGLFRHVLTRH